MIGLIGVPDRAGVEGVGEVGFFAIAIAIALSGAAHSFCGTLPPDLQVASSASKLAM